MKSLFWWLPLLQVGLGSVGLSGHESSLNPLLPRGLHFVSEAIPPLDPSSLSSSSNAPLSSSSPPSPPALSSVALLDATSPPPPVLTSSFTFSPIQPANISKNASRTSHVIHTFNSSNYSAPFFPKNLSFNISHRFNFSVPFLSKNISTLHPLNISHHFNFSNFSSFSPSFNHTAHQKAPSFPLQPLSSSSPSVTPHASKLSPEAKYVFVDSNSSFTFDAARARCEEVLAHGYLCSLAELALVSLKNQGPFWSAWGWTSSWVTEMRSRREKVKYKTSRLTQNGPTDGGAFNPQDHLSNAHCCRSFPTFRNYGFNDTFTHQQARRECGEEFGGHLCSVAELTHAHEAGARSTEWGWTNSPVWGSVSPRLNYHAARLWGGPHTTAQNTESWKGLAFCCRGMRHFESVVPSLRDYIVNMQVRPGEFREGLFRSFDEIEEQLEDSRNVEKEWPDLLHRSRTYDNAVAVIGLLLSEPTATQQLAIKACLRQMQMLLEVLGPKGAKSIPLAFNLKGSSDPGWKSAVYRVAGVAWIGQAFAMYSSLTLDRTFLADMEALALWVLAQQGTHGLMRGGCTLTANGSFAPIEEVTTEENIDCYFFLHSVSRAIPEKAEFYQQKAQALGVAIMNHLWDEASGTFSITLDTKGPGLVKIKALKMTARGAVFLSESHLFSQARSVLDHPFWLQHTVTAQEIRRGIYSAPGKGWGQVVWAEGSLGVFLATRRMADERAAYMLQDLERMLLHAGGVQMIMKVQANRSSTFPFSSVCASGWYLIARAAPDLFWRGTPADSSIGQL